MMDGILKKLKMLWLFFILYGYVLKGIMGSLFFEKFLFFELFSLMVIFSVLEIIEKCENGVFMNIRVDFEWLGLFVIMLRFMFV